MLYTGYYGGLNDLDRDKFILVQISNSCPIEPDVRFEKVIPDWALTVVPYKEGKITKEEYRERYITQLDKYKENIFAVIANMVKNGKDIIFLCYEKPGDFCHRHIFADYLNTAFGKKVVEEYDIEKVSNSIALF
jgi:uncharacterized protein YeaO (DUF488 family)